MYETAENLLFFGSVKFFLRFGNIFLLYIMQNKRVVLQ